MTHPFHPLSGQTFELVERRSSGREDRVYFFSSSGRLAGMPTSWTSLAAPDPFVVLAAGRSALRVFDLLRLVDLIGQAEGADDPSRTKGGSA